MNPIVPNLSVRPLGVENSRQVADLIGALVASAPYSTYMDTTRVEEEIFADNPPTIYPIRWQQHCRLGAWRAGQLVGFLDAAVGQDRDNLDLPDYHPLGLIRFLALPERADLVQETATALLTAVHRFWQETGVAYVKAFHVSTGYPSFQIGAGVLPGDWGEHFRILTLAGFQLRERFYCLFRPLEQTVEEIMPLVDLSLVSRGSAFERTYQLYYRRIDWVGHARVVRLETQSHLGGLPVSYLTDLVIEPRWRGQDIGKWLLRRLINDATLQGDEHMVVHLAHHHHVAMNLLTQHGFQELNYRGYTFDKTLTD